MSGDLAGYGIAIRNGFELAKKDNPDSFSHIYWEYQDSKYDGKAAVSALQALQAQGKFDLYHTWGVSPNEALLPIMEAKKLAVIAETTLKSTTVGKKYVVRAARTGEMLAAAILNELSRRNVKEVGLIMTEIPYYRDIVTSMQFGAKRLGITVEVINSYLGSDNDFRASILKARRKQYDAVGLFLLPSQFTPYTRQAQELGYSVQKFGSDIPDSQELIDSCVPSLNEMFFPSIGMTEEFREKYISQYGNEYFIGSAAQAYDVAMLIGKLFNLPKSPSLSSETIVNTFKQIKDHVGATGTFSFSESVDDGMAFHMPLAMKMVKAGKIVTIEMTP